MTDVLDWLKRSLDAVATGFRRKAFGKATSPTHSARTTEPVGGLRKRTFTQGESKGSKSSYFELRKGFASMSSLQACKSGIDDARGKNFRENLRRYILIGRIQGIGGNAIAPKRVERSCDPIAVLSPVCPH
jgi:hypothetical protein